MYQLGIHVMRNVKQSDVSAELSQLREQVSRMQPEPKKTFWQKFWHWLVIEPSGR